MSRSKLNMFFILGYLCTSHIKLVHHVLPSNKKTDTITNRFNVVKITNCYISFKKLQSCGLKDFKMLPYYQLM